MPLGLRLSDNGDNSGVTAAVAGSGGAAVTLRARAFEDTYTTRAWEAAGQRTGDGTAVLPLAPGHWWVYAETATERGAVLAVRPTDGLLPVITRARDAVAATLRLALPEGYRARVTVQFRFGSPAPSRPAVVLTADGLGETIDPDLSNTDLIGVPVLVIAAVTDPAAGDLALKETDRVRMAVIDAFHRRRAAGLPECRDCQVEAVSLDPDDPRTTGVTTGQLVRVFCRRVRPGGVQ